MAGLTLKAAVVIGIDFESPQVQFVRVEVEGRPARAVNYPALGDRVSCGRGSWSIPPRLNCPGSGAIILSCPLEA